MPQDVLTIATMCGSDAEMLRWWPAIVAAWPRLCEPPEARPARIEDLIDRLGTSGGGAGPVLVIFEAGDPPALASQLVDALQRAMRPAVLLFPELDAHAQALHGDGVIVERYDAEPVFIAAFLYALAERESAVRHMVRDLAIADSFRGGVRHEIDKLHDELTLAGHVQAELLPKRLPEVAGLDFGVFFRPTQYVSGDIYDVAELDEDHVRFFLADAVGHGVPAALLTMIISRGLQMTAKEDRSMHPGEALARLNEELLRCQRETPRFATAVYGVVNRRTREVTLASAGHPQPLVADAGGFRKVSVEGSLLGIFPDVEYEEASIVLEHGQTLIVYSDGFERVFPQPEGGELSEEHIGRLSSVCGSRADRSLPEAMVDLAMLLNEQAGSLHQEDDLTVVAVSPVKVAVAEVCEAA